MGFSESNSSKCTKHPNLRHLPGVCSSCLREKLSKLSTSPSFNRKTTTFISYSSTSSCTPPYSTASSASATTGTRKSSGSHHRRYGRSEAYVSVGMVLNNGLKKSRSVSCASISRTKLGNINNCVKNEKVINEKLIEDGNVKKKGGLLKKLIHNTSKKTKEVLTHSKTIKQRSYSSLSTNVSKNQN